MARSHEVALFIDYENTRYSVLNTYQREVSGTLLVELAARYGRVTLARAYAGFSAHPERCVRELRVAGIEPVDTADRRLSGTPRGSADLDLACDVFEALLDRPWLTTFVLVTGDGHYLRLVHAIQRRFGKRVVIAGVRGSVSNDLIEAAAGEFEPLVLAAVPEAERITRFVRFVDRLERSKPFITFKYVAAAMTTSAEFPGLAPAEAQDTVAGAIEDGILIKEQRHDGYRVLHLNPDAEVVRMTLYGDGEDDADAWPEGRFPDLDDGPTDDDPGWNR